MGIALQAIDMVVQIDMHTVVMAKTEPTIGMVLEEEAVIGMEVGEGLLEMIGAIGIGQVHMTGLAGEGTLSAIKCLFYVDWHNETCSL